MEREGEETIWLHTAHAHTRADHQSHRGMDEGHEQLPTRESTRNSDEEPLPFPLTECCSPPPPLSLSSWLVMFAAADTHYYSYDATLLRRFDALIEPSGTVAAAAQPSEDDNNRADSPPLCLELAEEEADQAEADAIAMAAAAAEALAHAAYSRTIPLLQPYHAARQRKAERRARRAAKKQKLASIKQREWAIKPPPHLPRHPRTPRFFMLFSPRPREPIPPRSQRWRPQEPLRPPPKMDDDSDDDEEDKRNEQCLVIGP